MSVLARVVLVAAAHHLCSAERSGGDNVQVTLSGKGILQVHSGHKVRHVSKEHRLEQSHHLVLLPETNSQAYVGLSLAAVMISINAILLFRSDLLASSSGGTMSSIAETTVGIMKNLIGAGILCLPIAASEMSVVGAMMGMTFCCLCSLSAFLLIGFACDRFNASSYGELMSAAFGNMYGTEWVCSRMNMVLLLHTLGGCIAYMTIIADISAKLAQDSFHMPELALRGTCVAFITVVFLLPLCLYDRLKSLSVTSWLGVMAMIVVAEFCVRDCIADWDTAHSAELLASHLLAFKGSFFKAIPLINGAYMVHYNAPIFFAETEGRSLFAYGAAAVVAHITVSLLYFAVAFAGFARFGDSVHGNILTSYEASGHNWVLTCWVCVLVNILFTFPLLFQRSRQSLMLILEPLTGTDSESAPCIPHQASADSSCETASVDTDVRSEIWYSPNGNSLYYTTTGGLLVFVAVCGTFLRHLDAIMMVREATIGVLLMYIFPAAICLRLLSKNRESVSGSSLQQPVLQQVSGEAVRRNSLPATKTSIALPASEAILSYDADTYRYYLCMGLLVAGVGSSCAALAAVIAQSLSLHL